LGVVDHAGYENTGRIDQDIEPAESRKGCMDQCGYLRWNRLVCLDGERTTAGAFDLLDEFIRDFGRSGVAEYDIGTVMSKAPNNGGTDPA
jgi:hypothetical protein